MRIIAGVHRSRVLVTPKGMATRPTSDRLRETLFNVLMPRVRSSRFLDLYAGSGANGLEALSRGAREAVLVEQAAPAIAAIRSNIASLGVEAEAKLIAQPVRRWFSSALAGTALPFDIIFLDPPYQAAQEYAETLMALGTHAEQFLTAEALVVAEHRSGASDRSAGRTPPSDAGPGSSYGVLERTRVLHQGDASLSFYRARALSSPRGCEVPGPR